MSYVEDPLEEPDARGTRTEVQHFEVSAEEAGQRLDNYVHKRLSGVPRSRMYRVIRKGEVRVNGRRAGPQTRLEPHDRIRIPPVRVMPRTDPGQPPPQLCATLAKAIIYEDDRLLVLDKPAGLAVHGGSGLSFGVIEALRRLRPNESLELVHRLDRDTSGCLLVARDAGTLRTLHALIRGDGAAQHAAHRVAGDDKYGDASFNDELRELGLRRMFLHAHSLSFAWPQGGEFSVSTPLPPELAVVLDELGARTDRTRRGELRADGNRPRAARPRAR